MAHGVIPSSLESHPTENIRNLLHKNVTLKIGQIININYPDPNNDKGVKITTYDVSAMDHSGGVRNNVIYRNCTISGLFGSAADFFEYTLRNNQPGFQKKDILSGAVLSDISKLTGAFVVLACIGGSTVNPVIIGAIRSPFATTNLSEVDKNTNTYQKASQDLGNYLTFNFNGIYFNINNDGEVLLNRNGPTDDQGNATGSGSEGSFLRIDQGGTITIAASDQNDITAPHNYITIERNGTITVDNQGKNQIVLQDGEVDIILSSGTNTFTVKNADANATAKLGNGAVSAAVAENLQILYNNLLTQLQNLTVATGMGPSSVPINAAAFPAWSSNIVSSALKIPQ